MWGGSVSCFGKLRGELTEDKMLAAITNQPERRDIPEHGRTTVAEDYLPAVRKTKE
jgi:hypothetical protein